MFITYEMLYDAGACEEQRDRFEMLFPHGVRVTEELCVKHAHDFDFAWAADELLSSPTARRAYQEADASAWETYQAAAWQACVEFREVRDSARQAYKEAEESARQAYKEAALRAYQEADASARQVYKEAVAWALEARKEAVARAFARAAALEQKTEEYFRTEGASSRVSDLS